MSLGKDLASLRKSQNLSLEDIQNAIKIPINILKSIEDESIFSDPSKNKTYVRSFVRSYAKVLKIEDEEIVRALDEHEKGQYTGGLVSEDEPIQSYQPPISSERTFSGDGDTDHHDNSEEEASSDEIEPEPSSERIPPKTPSKAQSQSHAVDEKSDIKNINWVDIGNSFSIDGKRSRTWVIFSVVVLVIAILAAMYFYRDSISNMFISSPDENEQVMENTSPSQDNMTISADTSATQENIIPENVSPNEDPDLNEESDAGSISTLGDTLTVVVYAAYSQLDPVRVTSDFNDRTNPFWMEQGEAYYFDFRDSLLVRGQYGELLLMFNGHIIENPRQNHFDDSLNSIVITRDILNQPRYLETAPDEFPLNIAPPDSIVYRVQF